MVRPFLSGGLLVLVSALAVGPVTAQDHQHSAPGEHYGVVHFQTSCDAGAQPIFDRAVAALHSFEFGVAIDTFHETLRVDPACAIAYWGIALAQWTNPFAVGIRPAALLDSGLKTVRQAQQIRAGSPRERAYINAVTRLYVDADKTDQSARVIAYENAMADLAAAYPDDREASIFWALALATSAPPTDKTYASQLRAGAMLEKLFIAQPDHPGIAHYIIHTYDVPALADRAVDAARRYSKIAPSAPHALHMPSHTFTRVGAWQESIDTNEACVVAAELARAVTEELHAMDYMTYAYLQTGQDSAARRLLVKLPDLQARIDNGDFAVSAAPLSAGVFALAAMPARQVLEHRDWASAARLVPRSTSIPFADALSHFARALGAARLGALDDARSSIHALGQLRDTLTAAGERYWAEQVAIQREGAAAFVALADGRTAEALTTMRGAADREDATEKNVVTPGPVLPAREMLGDMLLELQQPGAALTEFEIALKKEPKRLRTLYGAARAAMLDGDTVRARTYYSRLLAMCDRADEPGRPELAEARQALGR